jgi:hypothetical protein
MADSGGWVYLMRVKERWQAAFHCCFVMWVSRSQKPMQSLKLLPPPPAALGACSLALPGERANELGLAAPPLDDAAGGCEGDSGAVMDVCGAGVPIAEGGAGVAVAAGFGGP